MIQNPLLRTDSYKHSHYKQYPPGAEAMFSYIETRGSNFPYKTQARDVMLFGLQAYIKEYLLRPITQHDIDQAEPRILRHGLPFNREGFEKVVDKYRGYVPVKINAVPEGLRVPFHNVLATVECDDPDLFWMANFIETSLVRAVWYPSTVATLSRACRDLLYKELKATSDDPDAWIATRLHDFAARGVSSAESAHLGGMAHLVNFTGTDTLEALEAAEEYYGEEMAGYSIPAAEHSTITAWGEGMAEADAFRNILREFARPGAVVAVVSDSYNIYRAAEKIWGEELRQQVIDSGAIVVVRPDSGDPTLVAPAVVQTLGEKYGYTVNNKGYKVLNNVRVIQGDGVNPDTIARILYELKRNGWSAENIAFGMGGALLQRVNRDSLGFTQKLSAIKIDGQWRDVYKNPVDGGKKSRPGRLTLVRDRDQTMQTVKIEDAAGRKELLEPVYDCGRLLRDQKFSEIRRLANLTAY